ncbi:MAG: hypothetical protein KDD50_07465 [Bdellovibrionales bacterium]|nr:hypothetical protein [Bdellovibrionales bacterium]MCB0414155.1 hypothetical protein [Bdellovibrionales bacterium]
MKLSAITLLSLFISAQAFASQCPTIELEGTFKVVERQGCEGYDEFSQVTGVQNDIQASSLITGFIFNNADEPSQRHWIEETMNASSMDCVNTETTKSWRWYPQNPRSNFYWGFAYRAGTYYAERGHSCRYKLQKL